MFHKIILSIKNKTFIKKVKRKLKKIIVKIITHSSNIHPKKVFFITFQGKYTCNPKAIAEEFIERNSDYKLVWEIRKEDKIHLEQYPKQLKLVVRGSYKFYKEIASSKFIIENANDIEYMHYEKKEGQIFIQTWHGSLGFKRLDESSVKDEKWIIKAKKLGAMTDYCISNSSFENDVFRTSYWPDTKILEYGHTRNDLLLNKEKSENTKNKVKQFYNIPKMTKILLYAPTFRDNVDGDTYNLNYSNLLQTVKNRFGGDWVLMIRFHFKLRHVEFSQELQQNIINATDYYDMQDLLCACDIGLTDYSSWICDYVLTGRPGFLYINDIEKYVDERGFYYPLSETPFPIAKTNEELVEKILNFDEKLYEKERIRFLADRGCFESGNASQKIVDKIYTLNETK